MALGGGGAATELDNSASKRPKSQAQNNSQANQQRSASASQNGNGQELTAAFSRPELAVLEAFFTDTLTDLGDGDMN